MKFGLAVGAIGGFVIACLVAFQVEVKGNRAMAADADKSGKLVVHNVYFTLNESNAANRQKLIDACKKYLVHHPGVIYFAVGTVSDLSRPVNDRDWDIGLHVIFQDRAAHDQYQPSAPHVKFIEDNRASWKQVRVFDTDAEAVQPR